MDGAGDLVQGSDHNHVFADKSLRFLLIVELVYGFIFRVGKDVLGASFSHNGAERRHGSFPTSPCAAGPAPNT